MATDDRTATAGDARDLDAFRRSGSPEAFARLAARYAGMVFSACVRRLGNAADAEDASQAAFLVLARHARKVRAECLAAWLHRTAVRAASVVARSRARRARHEEEAAHMRAATVGPSEPAWAEARQRLDDELAGLPEKLREAVARQFLAGQSRADVARELGIPEGTVASRVSAGLDRLRRGLARGGVAFSAATLGAALASEAQAAVPQSLLASLPHLATGAAAGAAAGGGASVATVAEGVMKMMFWAKVKLAAAAVAAITVVGAGGGAVAVGLVAGEPAAAKGDSVLARTAAALKPGSWAVLNKDADGSGYGAAFTASGTGVGGMYTFASKATYDPARRRVFYLAGGHSQDPRETIEEVTKFIVYEVDSNKWTRLATPGWVASIGGNPHGYQLQALGGGKYFRVWANGYRVFACDVDREKVSDIGGKQCTGDYPDPAPSPPGGVTARGTLDYFPDRNSLVFLDSASGTIYEKVLAAPAWKQLATGLTGLAGDGVAAAYNPVRKVLVLGGGSRGREWHKIDAEGKLSRLDDSPIACYATDHALFTADPAGGKYILIAPDDTQNPTELRFYELDVTKEKGSQWSRRADLEAAIPQFYSRKNLLTATVVVPLPGFGAMMFMGYNQVWIYRHSDKPGAPAGQK